MTPSESSPTTETAAHRAAPIPLGSFPLSVTQEELWFAEQLQPGTSAYNLPEAWLLDGELDVNGLRSALTQLIERHETLRTEIRIREGVPMQAVLPSFPAQLPVTEAAGQSDAELDQMLRVEARRPFDLGQAPLLRCQVFRRDERRHVLFVNLHHIVADAWSQAVLMREWFELYRAQVERRKVELPALPIQYADYAVWSRSNTPPDETTRDLEWWKTHLQGISGDTPLPTDSQPAASTRSPGATQFATLDKTQVEHLRQLGRAHGATLYMTLLTAFFALLQRLTRRDDLAVGTPWAGRDRAETEGLIGHFARTLPLRATMDRQLSFVGLLQQVRQTLLQAHSHPNLQLMDLVRELQPHRQPGRSPLFQVVFGLQPAGVDRYELPQLATSKIELDSGAAKFDWTLLATETSHGLRLRSEFRTDLFHPRSAGRFLDLFQALLQGILAAPQVPVSDIPLVEASETRRLLALGSETGTAYERDQCVHQVFENRAAARPEAVALRFKGQVTTYRELNDRANCLATRLRDLGVGPGSVVALYLDRSPEFIQAALAALKAGAAYLPLDKSYPASRLDFMLRDSGAAALVASELVEAGQFPGFSGKLLVIGSLAQDLPTGGSGPGCQSHPGRPSDLAYIMYTSGSTGTPKGVAVPHRAVVRLVRGTNYLEFSPEDVFLQLAPTSFDASTFEIWGALLNGAALSIFPDRFPSLQDLGRTLSAEKITTLWLTAALFNQVVDSIIGCLSGVRNLLTGGEALSVPHVMKALEFLPQCRLINGYGPTESTTFACCFDIRDLLSDPGTPVIPQDPGTWPRSIPIGRPIANTTVFILDERLQPCPEGVPGELWIGGDGLALGYFNRPELTAAKFISVPELGGRLYRTGDLARWLPGGRIEFLGRLDNQIKIRGYRVEPGEIEAALRLAPGVREAAVLLVPDNAGSPQLAAYVTAQPDTVLSSAALHEFLHRRLPGYMVPSGIVCVDALPLTPNGKIDRSALPRPEAAGISRGEKPPATPDEERILQIWKEVLRRNSFGVDSNFFHLGGHSLLATQAMFRVSQALGADLPVRMLFENPTVESLCTAIAGARPRFAEPNRPKTRQERSRRASDLLNRIDELSPEQVEALLQDADLVESKP